MDSFCFTVSCPPNELGFSFSLDSYSLKLFASKEILDFVFEEKFLNILFSIFLLMFPMQINVYKLFRKMKLQISMRIHFQIVFMEFHCSVNRSLFLLMAELTSCLSYKKLVCILKIHLYSFLHFSFISVCSRVYYLEIILRFLFERLNYATLENLSWSHKYCGLFFGVWANSTNCWTHSHIVIF